MAYGSINVGTGSAILVVPNNTNRKSIIITNEGDSKIYLGNDSSITSSSTISIESGGKFTEDSGGQRMFLGDIYAISEDSTNDVRYWERV
jgi:hypothetical protein